MDDIRFLLNSGKAVLGHLRDFMASDSHHVPLSDESHQGTRLDLPAGGKS